MTIGCSRNYAGYKNDKVDELLKKMGETEPGAERDQISKDIQAIVAEDLPIIYLVDPQWHVALSDRVSDYVPYCGDYYCVNADLGL
jgi:peptide/nickel transport system substrate-binding protein